MLNKDEYNQEEYNDYYAKEVRGAEISSEKKSQGSGKKILFILLLLLLIIALAYFGWKSISHSSSTPTNIGKTDITSEKVNTTQEDKKEVTTESKAPIVNEAIKKETETKEPIVNKATTNETDTKESTEQKVSSETKEEKIAKEVQNITSKNNNKKMSPEDVASIVQIVMKKINQDKNKELTEVKSETKPTKDNSEQLKDSKLMESLSTSEVDSLSTVSDNVTSTIKEADNSKKASSSDTPNTYNKVVLDAKIGKSSDELSKLSEEISSVIGTEESTSKDNTKYTQEITKEVEIREKEMRYITVRKGDTLGKIAQRVYGNVMDYKKIYEANPDILRRPDKIYIGQKLRIPE